MRVVGPGAALALALLVWIALVPSVVHAAEPPPSPPSFPWPTLERPDQVPVSAPFRPTRPPDATRTTRGVRVELWLSSASVAPGEWVQALVRTTNLGRRPVWSWPGECGRSGLLMTVDLGSIIPPGRDQIGNAAQFKMQAVRHAVGMVTGFVSWQDLRQYYTLAVSGGYAPIECTIGTRPRKLDRGVTREERFAWYPASTFDENRWYQPLFPGEVTVTVEWPFLGRGPRPSLTPRRAHESVKPITATTTIELTGDGPGTPSLPELVDIALADPQFRAWVDEHPVRHPWPGVSVLGWSGPTYENHLWLRELADPPPTGILTLEQDRRKVYRGVISLDPWTGEVVDMRFLGPSFDGPALSDRPRITGSVRGEPPLVAGSLPAWFTSIASMATYLWPDAPVPDSVAAWLPAARKQLRTSASDGLRLPLHFRFIAARCNSDGGVALLFEELGPPYLRPTYAYAVRGRMPSSSNDAWGGAYGLPSVPVEDPEFIHLMGSDTVPCP